MEREAPTSGAIGSQGRRACRGNLGEGSPGRCEPLVRVGASQHLAKFRRAGLVRERAADAPVRCAVTAHRPSELAGWRVAPDWASGGSRRSPP